LLRPRIDQSSAWSFALSLYKEPTVASACLTLQDDFNCNVNLVLFCHYADSLGYLFGTNDFLAIERAIAASEEQLKRHRTSRRLAKTQSPEQYQAMLSQELTLEHAQHQLIIDTANTLCENAEQTSSTGQSRLTPTSLQHYLNEHELNDQQIKKYCDIINRIS